MSHGAAREKEEDLCEAPGVTSLRCRRVEDVTLCNSIECISFPCLLALQKETENEPESPEAVHSEHR